MWLELSERSNYSWRDRQEPDLENPGEGLICFVDFDVFV